MNKKFNPFNTEAEQFMRNIQLSLHQLERENHRKRCKARMEAQLAAGRRMFGSPPSWYQMKDGLMQPFMPNAKIVRKTYQSLIKGKLEKSSTTIIAFMEGLGFTNRDGNPIRPTRHHVRTLLSERAIMEAAGFLQYRMGWIKANHQAIISEQEALHLLGKSKIVKPNCEAVVYCRTASKHDNTGIKNQEKVCRAYCKANGYRVAAVFKDEATSGNTRERSALNDLMAYINKKSKPRVVVVTDMSRIARDVVVGMEIFNSLKLAGCKVESAISTQR